MTVLQEILFVIGMKIQTLSQPSRRTKPVGQSQTSIPQKPVTTTLTPSSPPTKLVAAAAAVPGPAP